MSVTYKPWENGSEYGTHYHFDEPGDGIPMHSHASPATRHSTRCLNGSASIYGDVPTTLLRAGDTVVFKSYRLHELVALEANTEIINVFDHGKPADYENMPVEQLSGRVASVLMGKEAFDRSK